jgi:tellurium resistance protein TerD
MSISLVKGGNVSLGKQVANLRAVVIGLGWDERATTGIDFDLDASALMLDSNGRILSDHHFVFFNNLLSPDKSVEHTGDNLNGGGDGDDEMIKVNLNEADGREITRFDLSEDASSETAMIFGELYRHQNEWKFRAVGQGYASGLAGIARDFGVRIG